MSWARPRARSRLLDRVIAASIRGHAEHVRTTRDALDAVALAPGGEALAPAMAEWGFTVICNPCPLFLNAYRLPRLVTNGYVGEVVTRPRSWVVWSAQGP
jgi:hypothetical protein